VPRCAPHLQPTSPPQDLEQAHPLSTRTLCATQGAFCHKYCNPHNVQLLEDAHADAKRK
jgi:hypothetical protein